MLVELIVLLGCIIPLFPFIEQEKKSEQEIIWTSKKLLVY